MQTTRCLEGHGSRWNYAMVTAMVKPCYDHLKKQRSTSCYMVIWPSAAHVLVVQSHSRSFLGLASNTARFTGDSGSACLLGWNHTRTTTSVAGELHVSALAAHRVQNLAALELAGNWHHLDSVFWAQKPNSTDAMKGAKGLLTHIITSTAQPQLPPSQLGSLLSSAKAAKVCGCHPGLR